MYPIRTLFPNVITGVSQWVTVGYLPHLKPRHAHTRNEDDKLRVVRNQLRQRCLAVLLDRFITASRDGEHVTLKEHGTWTVFPRICLYVADLPEERHILGLMLGRCHRLCSHCLAEQGDLGAAQLAACSRSVAATLAMQLEAALLFDKHTGTGSIKRIGAMHSATPFVPIPGAVHGLGTGTMALYKIISFDSLHIVKLGMLRDLGAKIPQLLAALCQGGEARYGFVANSLIAVNERVLFLGRLCTASKYPPGRRKTSTKKRARSVSPAAADSLAACLAGASDCTGDEAECDDHQPVIVNAAGAMYEKAFPGMSISDAVLEVVCRAAALTGRLCGDNRAPGMTITEKEAKELADEAHTFITKYVAGLLGAMNTSMFHRLANHLFAALMDHGNLTDGDTSVNEGLHKKCKRMYARKNKKVDDYTLQMLHACETLSHVLDEAAKEQAEAERLERVARGEGSVSALATEADADPPTMEWSGGALRIPPVGDEDSSGDEAVTRREPV
ncbi:hypothetical protein I4F81_003547 [Pyropia yezoensis]|uniref:Uncharacterized protein n=1 Tax=Pyropia yezoensis TaxID=2788 RepID=A0ACC3BU36_PYRYE|nr:hypothetical protein I4F81_003547 [Neopyropia yezoensis]